MKDLLHMRSAALRAVLASLALGAAASGCGGDSKAGSLGEDCYPNDTCNAGLSCQAGKCVAPNGQGGAGGSSTGTGTTGAQTGGSGTGTTGGAGGTTSTGTGTGTMNGAPVIVTLGSNVTSITEGESVTITAVVTDPDGIDDVIGGNLTDPSSAVYGAFATTGQEGAYQMTLSWAQLQQVQSIDFAQGANAQRTLVATFFDQAAHSVQKSLTITLACMGNGACAGVCKNMSADTKNCGTCGNSCATGATCTQSACVCPSNGAVCSGVCKDTQTDEANCGACGNVCPTGTTCYGGVCGTLSACTTNYTSCNQACAAAGKTCHPGCAGTGGAQNVAGIVYHATTCSNSASPGNALTCTDVIATTYAEKCCCY